MHTKNVFLLLASVVATNMAGLVGSLYTSSEIGTWYLLIEKPFFTPPNWLFAPVWIVLYTLMGIALFLVLQAKRSRFKQKALCLFVAQFILNILWTPVFFGLHSFAGGFILIVLLLCAIVLTVRAFVRISPPAAWLLAPYCAWVAYAAVLSAALWYLNA